MEINLEEIRKQLKEMKRRSILKKLAFAPLVAAMATELAFSQPDPPKKINGRDIKLFIGDNEISGMSPANDLVFRDEPIDWVPKSYSFSGEITFDINS